MSTAAVEVLNRLQRRCDELENQLALERQKRETGETDDIALQYRQRTAAADDDKLKVSFHY